MSLPAAAFGELYPKELPLGSVFKFRESWALRVAHGPADSAYGFLMLEGEHTGELFLIDEGMARSVSVIAPFGWFPAVSQQAVSEHTGSQTATLALTDTGPVVIGIEAVSSRFDPEYFAFRTDGSHDSAYGRFGLGPRFAIWSAELEHPARPFESLGQLFAINRVAKQSDNR